MAPPARPGKSKIQALTRSFIQTSASSSGAGIEQKTPPKEILPFLRGSLVACREDTSNQLFHHTSNVKSQSPEQTATDAKALSGSEYLTNPVFENAGPTPQPLRAFSGFAGQQAPQNRNQPLGSARLQNSKIGGCCLASGIYFHYS